MKVSKAFLVFFAVILIFSAAYIYACRSPGFNVTEIKIRGNDKISVDEIRKKADSCLNKNVLSLNLERIEEKLREDWRLKEVRVKRRLPSTILIELEEKSPVLWISLPISLLEPGNCGFYGLSIDQEIIPLDQTDLSRDLPIVSGIQMGAKDMKTNQALEPYRRWSNFRVEKALDFYNTQARVDPSSLELIAEINLKDVSNLVLYLPPKIKVMMGQGDFERKWRRVRTILAGEEKIEELVCLDLRFDDQVVLTRSSKGSSYRAVHHGNAPSDKGGDNL